LYFIIIDIKKIEMITMRELIPLVSAKEFPPVPILSAYSTPPQAGVAVSLADAYLPVHMFKEIKAVIAGFFFCHLYNSLQSVNLAGKWGPGVHLVAFPKKRMF